MGYYALSGKKDSLMWPWQYQEVTTACVLPECPQVSTKGNGTGPPKSDARRHSKCLFVCLLMVVCSQFSCCKHLIQLRTKQ